MLNQQRAPESRLGAPERAARLETVRREMVRRGLSAVVVASPQNICYLSGLDFVGYFAWPLLVVPSADVPLLVMRAMEEPTVRAQVPDYVHVGYLDGTDPAAAAQVLEDLLRPGETVGLESWHVPLGIGKPLEALLPGLRWCDATGLVEQASVRKSASEVACVRAAAAISDRGMQAGLDAAGVGAADNEVAAAVYREIVAAGSEYPAAPPLVRRADVIDQDHVTWTGRRLRPGDGLFIELSASVGRYHAPLTRMAHVGYLPARVEAAAEVAASGLDTLCRELRPGAVGGDLYRVWEDAVGGADAGPRPIHQHCGYLVGIGFPPTWMEGNPLIGLRPGGNLVVQEGMVFHLVSWIREPVGYALSDTVLVTSTGCEVLTETTRTPRTAS